MRTLLWLAGFLAWDLATVLTFGLIGATFGMLFALPFLILAIAAGACWILWLSDHLDAP